jgi:hypothetical protein
VDTVDSIGQKIFIFHFNFSVFSADADANFKRMYTGIERSFASARFFNLPVFRVSDTDPDPAFFLIADPDPGFDDLKLKKITAEK